MNHPDRVGSKTGRSTNSVRMAAIQRNSGWNQRRLCLCDDMQRRGIPVSCPDPGSGSELQSPQHSEPSKYDPLTAISKMEYAGATKCRFLNLLNDRLFWKSR